MSKFSSQKKLRAAIDQIGFANEPWDQVVKPLQEDVKYDLQGGEIAELSTDFFNAKMVDGGFSAIDATRFFRLYKNQKITEAQFISCLSIRTQPAREFMSGAQIAEISNPVAKAPSLRITRHKVVQLELANCLQGLGEAVAEKAAA